jgi:hypothetical protein
MALMLWIDGMTMMTMVTTCSRYNGTVLPHRRWHTAPPPPPPGRDTHEFGTMPASMGSCAPARAQLHSQCNQAPYTAEQHAKW